MVIDLPLRLFSDVDTEEQSNNCRRAESNYFRASPPSGSCAQSDNDIEFAGGKHDITEHPETARMPRHPSPDCGGEFLAFFVACTSFGEVLQTKPHCRRGHPEIDFRAAYGVACTKVPE